ncbi:hypothetical protein CLV98_104246 [Dyadobacter jejuensis]|uniref:Uncharacterized protein n=1 Tax=Dyadobacter jejuensis TaxID=1082580 RepID=A0A316B713_9BACT|nr:hypothetical protein [Dyadobacter jejuensis]PWJ58387.1 hypothetical protein CLV98_104246 [Dyadobacter jejuensis]
MRTNENAIRKYALFGSKLRGSAYIESVLEALLLEMETPANLKKLGAQMKVEWSRQSVEVQILSGAFKHSTVLDPNGMSTRCFQQKSLLRPKLPKVRKVNSNRFSSDYRDDF